MQPRNIIGVILLVPLFLSGCGLRQFGEESPSDSASTGNPVEQGLGNTPGAGDQLLSPQLEASHVANLPFLAHSEGQGFNWQLVPKEMASADENLNLRIQVMHPVIEDAGGEVAANFNQAMQQLVQEELDVKDQIGAIPIEDPGGFLLLGFQVTSAPDWSSFEPYAISDSNPGILESNDILLNSGHQVLGILFEIVTYFGGAHPASHHRGFNFDVTTGEVLSLADLFKPESNYLDVIAGYSIQELKKNQEILFQDFEHSAAPSAQNYEVWSLTPHGLMVVFEEYQVAPYAAGPQYVVVPYEVLGGLLDPGAALSKYSQ